ncbi:MAG: hypothetical protein QM736_04910 [Vicinamibacterales bacterium]
MMHTRYRLSRSLPIVVRDTSRLVRHVAWEIAIVSALMCGATPARAADPMACAMDTYKAQTGLTATMAADVLTVQWAGDRNQELRMRFALEQATPTIQELAARRAGGTWGTIATRVTPDYRVTTGLRRMSNQQMQPLRGLGVALTDRIVDTFRWDPFWDAPLDLSAAANRSSNPPPAAGVANQPGLPRTPNEIARSTALCRQHLPREHRWRTACRELSRRHARRVQRRAPVHVLQGDEPRRTGDIGVDVDTVGGVQ